MFQHGTWATWETNMESRTSEHRPVGIEAPPERSARLHSQTKVHSVAPSPDHDHPRALLGVALIQKMTKKSKKT